MVDSFRLPPEFLRDVVDTHWARTPKAWHAPWQPAFGSDDDIFRALCALTALLEQGEATETARLFLDGEPAGFHLGVHAARPDDADLAGFERRLRESLGGRQMGLLVSEAMSLDPKLWRRARRFQRALYEAVGMPAGAHSEIFLGNYRQSFFGVHKDRLETFTFVIQGRKRFLTWPYELLADLPDGPPGGPLHQFRFEDFDVEAFRDQAVVLEGGPGDVFYWPAEYWHVAEDASGEFVTTLTLAFARSSTSATGSPFRLAEEGHAEAGKDGYTVPEAPLPPVLGPTDVAAAISAADAHLQALLADPVVSRKRREAMLIWLSTGGFKRAPEKIEPADFTPDQWIAFDAACPILWDAPSEDGFPCVVNGIVLTTLPQFLPLCEALNQGGVFRVGDLMERFSAAEGAPSAEEIREALCHLAGALAVWAVDAPSAADPSTAA